MPDRNVTPEMPKTQAEWECHWAFYQLTLKERDYERIVNDRLRAELKELRIKTNPLESFSNALLGMKT